MAVIAYQYRGDLVDQIHRGHIAVTDHTGKILWKLGDPERLTFARSSAKPLQAIPVAESGALEHYGITPQELAVICSSHNGEPFHVKAVESILHKAGLSPDQLCCGSEYPMYVPAEDALKIAGISPGAHLLRLLRKARRYAHHRPPFRGVFGRLYCFGAPRPAAYPLGVR